MTQEEKARAYDEAIEKINGCPTDKYGCLLGIKPSDIFPQLKESEDERIRKALLRCCDDWEKGQFGCMAKEDIPAVRAWLEKQKTSEEAIRYLKENHSSEKVSDFQAAMNIAVARAYDKGVQDTLEKQKEPQSLRDGEIEDRKRDVVAAIRKCYPADYAEYLTSFLKGLSPEDNSEDEYGQEMLGIAYKLMYEHIPENLRTQEFWDSLKFMREYTGKVAIIHSYEKPAEWSEEDKEMIMHIIHIIEGVDRITKRNYCIEISWLKALIERLKPQSKVEQSEENERMLESICKYLDNYKAYCSDITANYIETYKKRLKSLKLRLSWKPSEEQIRVFLKATPVNLMPEEFSIYNSFRNDIQKLM